jgi:flagellar hook-basal body complex protein FliE
VQTLKNAIGSVDSLQKDSDLKMQMLATGQNTNIHETMIAAEKADVALRLMVQVRNKIIEAYQEIMRMQV